MKGVPVRRVAIPRIPMPPEILRAPADARRPRARRAARASSPHEHGHGRAPSRHRPLPYPVLPVLRAANGAGLIHPDDRRYGTLLVGGQGSGKTAAMLRTYLNDIRDDNAAVVVLDPKSELSRLCLQLTPPDTPKRVWFLDLGHPAFGMSPLRLTRRANRCRCRPPRSPTTSSPRCWTSTRTRSSSPRAATSTTPSSARSRSPPSSTAAPASKTSTNCCCPPKPTPAPPSTRPAPTRPTSTRPPSSSAPNCPRTSQLAGSATAQRLDAPRNKVSGLTGVPPLRRFFNHTSDVALADIVDARDILIVDANMAAIGAENSKACMHFVLRMLHTQLQRQVRRPETDRPRVALLADEAHYLASAENVVDQIATHRAAGLDVTFGLQYLAQLGSGSEHEQKIRKGIVNLLQSRFLFRLGDHEDAEDAVRIAMAVYSTMIRDDPDSRARLRVTPEQILNLPVHHCLASWIAGGTRAASFIGQTFPFPTDITDAWARTHLQRLHDAVGPYPETMASTLDPARRPPSRTSSAREPHADASPRDRRAGDNAERPPTVSPQTPAASAATPPDARSGLDLRNRRERAAQRERMSGRPADLQRRRPLTARRHPASSGPPRTAD